MVYFIIVETRYVPLEEIARYFDGGDIDVAAAANAEVEKHNEKGMTTAMEVEVA